MRPALKPALRRLWRDPATVQLGLDADRAVVVGGLAPGAARLLQSLDGSREAGELLQGAPSYGVDATTARVLLDLLADSGVVEDAAADRRVLRELAPVVRERLLPDLSALSLSQGATDGGAAALRARLSRRVRVHGAGRVGATVAALLAAAGVGTVEVEDSGTVRPGDLSPGGHAPDGLGAPRGAAAERAATRWSARPADQARDTPSESPRWAGGGGRPVAADHPDDASRADAARTSPHGGQPAEGALAGRPAGARAGGPGVRAAPALGSPPPDLAVLAPTVAPAPQLVESLVRSGVPHLLVVVRETTAVVDPLVLPGRSACLRCLDLHRTDRDPAWPRLAAQLAVPGTPPADSCDVALSALAAASAALQALAHLDGDESPPARGGTLETTLPAGPTRRRSWSMHPLCGCGWGGRP
ncbi:ThiF family adenylyltransferase [Motilibacter deserti]|uniref:Thiamine biosynthesis protein ThiF n=1 Tax=Motilibacter deserti TaxID=2714956 RepID=A0ABX0GRB9_9ACTN|nr:ThiF family adenylyltransferase [Motilibacter deserti]NHC13282.1 thiamine biosynthesis protein ThiF [Motilibacter deserti]